MGWREGGKSGRDRVGIKQHAAKIPRAERGGEEEGIKGARFAKHLSVFTSINKKLKNFF